MILKSDNDSLFSTHDRWISIVILLAVLIVTGGCSAIPTQGFTKRDTKMNIANACSIISNKQDWYESMDKSYRKWGTPMHVQMAIIHQESKFKADARPPRKKGFWFLPGPRPSTAFGYSQALDGTWKQYKEQTNNSGADRDDFDDAVDFIGWYNNISHKKLRIANSNAKSLYLAYHEGHGGYARKSYRKKKWLVKVSKKVAANARRYQAQLKNCKKPSGSFAGFF